MVAIPKTIIATLGIAATTYEPASAGGDAGKDSAIASASAFGRIMVDYAHAEGENTPFKVDETELRNARLGGKVIFANGIKIRLELHTNGSGDVALTDAYVQFNTPFEFAGLQVGQFKTPNSIDEDTSSRFTTLLERAAFTDAFELNRRVGAALTGKRSRLTYMFGVFGQNIDDDATFGGYAVAGRATINPKIDVEDVDLHIGASFRYRDIDADQPSFQYRQRPVTHIPGRIVGTGRLADSDFFAGIEGAVIKGPFWAAGEYAATFADCPSCPDDPNLSGGYIEAGYMFNGRRKFKGGKFDRPEIGDGRFGAASVALRLDSLDLDDAAVSGGVYRAIVLGADWWPKKYLRFGVNGFIADADLSAESSGLDSILADAVSSGLLHETVKGVTLRAQIDFWTQQ